MLSLAKMMGLFGSLASVNTIGIRVVSAATTNGPRSSSKPSTSASAAFCSPDLSSSVGMTALLDWHATDMDLGADHTAPVLAPFTGGPGEGVRRKRHRANNADVVGRAAAVGVMPDVINLHVHQVVGTCHGPTNT